MTRIAVGGFLHETNTFAPTKAVYDAFVQGGGWPPMSQGAKLLEKMRNINVGMAGFVPAAETEGWELVPTTWCAASPSAHVTKDAYERVAQAIVDGIKAAGAIDGVYLDLHGAMVAEHIDDGEGEILARGSRKAQLADQAMFRYVGIEPTEQSILVNKSSVHFRADFEPIAEKLIICAAPGAMPADTAALPWTRLRPGIRIKPNGPAFAPETKSRSSSSATG